MCIVNIYLKLFFQVLKIVWSSTRDWLYFTLLRIFYISHFEKNIIILEMRLKPPPNIVLT